MQQVKYKRHFDRKVQALPTFTVWQHVYVNRPPFALIAEEKKTTTRYKKLLSSMTGLFTVMGVKGLIISIDKNGIANTIFIDRATPVLTKDHVMTGIMSSVDRPARAVLSRNTNMECKEPLEYIVDKVVDHRHTSKDLIYLVGWYGYTKEEDT